MTNTRVMLYRSLSQIASFGGKSAVAIGNFDGMHLGHKYIINNLIAAAKLKGLRSCVILFEPQPQQFFAKASFRRIMSFREKYEALTKLGVDDIICLRFNESLASISHEYFYEEILTSKLRMQALIVGHDFHFGKDRLGDQAFLRSQTSSDGISLAVIEPRKYSSVIISSSKIRDLIKANSLAAAAKLLGHPYAITGKVMTSSKPWLLSANIALNANRVINNGIYLVKISIADKTHYGLAKIASSASARTLTVRCLARAGSIHGVRVKVSFIFPFFGACRMRP